MSRVGMHRWAMVGLGVGLGILWGPAAARAETDDSSSTSTRSSSITVTPSGTDETTTTTSTTDEASEPSHCVDSGVTVTFDVGSTQINGRGRSSLNGVAKWLKSDQGRSVEVNGYTDDTGPAAMNQQLSQGRANAVKSYLVSQGIDGDRIDATGHGMSEKRPADLENTRAVAVTACEGTEQAAVQQPPPPAMPPAPEAVPPPPPPPAPQAQHTRTETTTVIVPPPPAPPPKTDLPLSRIGVALSAGAGATGFWEEGARNFADNGGTWDARLTMGTRLPFAVEAAYVGSAQAMKSVLGLDNDAVLLGNGAEGDARINFTRARIQPYIFGGGGWVNYRLQNTSINTASIQRSDNSVYIPFGAGIAARFGKGFLLDLRGTGRIAFDDGLFKQAAASTSGGDAGLNSWSASGNLGWEF